MQQGAFFQVISARDIDARSSEAQELRSFLRRSGNTSPENIDWESLKIVRMNVDGYEGGMSVIIASIHIYTRQKIKMYDKKGRKLYSVSSSHFYYIPNIDKSFTIDRHIDGDYKNNVWSGVARYNTQSGTSIVKIEGGDPATGIGSASDPQTSSKGCLTSADCSTWECYKTATEACDTDGECKFLCNALGMACDGAILAACAYHNA